MFLLHRLLMMDPSMVVGNNMQAYTKVQTTMKVMGTEMRTLRITVKTMNDQVDMNPSSMLMCVVMMDPSMSMMMTAYIDFMGNNM